jgi:hypothetical protein
MYKILTTKAEEKRRSDVGMDEGITLKHIFKEWNMSRLTIFFWVQPRTYFLNYLKVLTVY